MLISSILDSIVSFLMCCGTLCLFTLFLPFHPFLCCVPLDVTYTDLVDDALLLFMIDLWLIYSDLNEVFKKFVSLYVGCNLVYWRNQTIEFLSLWRNKRTSHEIKIRTIKLEFRKWNIQHQIHWGSIPSIKVNWKQEE